MWEFIYKSARSLSLSVRSQRTNYHPELRAKTFFLIAADSQQRATTISPSVLYVHSNSSSGRFIEALEPPLLSIIRSFNNRNGRSAKWCNFAEIFHRKRAAMHVISSASSVREFAALFSVMLCWWMRGVSFFWWFHRINGKLLSWMQTARIFEFLWNVFSIVWLIRF